MAIVRVKVSAETSKASVSVSSQLWPAAAASCEEVIRYPCEREPRPPPTHSSHTTRLSFTTLLLLLLLQFSLHHVTVHDQPYGTAAPRLRSAAVGISGKSVADPNLPPKLCISTKLSAKLAAACPWIADLRTKRDLFQLKHRASSKKIVADYQLSEL